MKKQFKNLIFTLFLLFTLVFIAGCELPQGTGNSGTNNGTIINPETLQVPSDFQVTSGTKCNAIWTVDENAVSHKIFIYKDNELLSSLSGTSGVEITGLEENGTYQAAIKVIGDGTYFYSSDLSEKVTFEFTGGINAELPKLTTPTDITASYDKTTSQLTINFKDCADYTNAIGYKVFLYNNSTLVSSYSLSRNGGYVTVALENGTYNVKVKVLADNETYQDSSLSTEKVTFRISDGTTSKFDYTSYSNYYLKAKDLTGDDLEEALRTIITSTHEKETSYGDLRYSFVKTDADPDKSGNVILFYSRQSVSGTWNGSTFNREHVWPKSNSDTPDVSNSTCGAMGDAHHLRPADPNVNSTRSNYKVGYVTTNKKEIMFKSSTHTYCYIGGGYFEPRDEVKGDIARIYFYLLTRYKSLYKYLPNVADIKDLLEWNELDPVDQLEINRNNAVQNIQGNRNPFIDNSDFANLIWG